MREWAVNWLSDGFHGRRLALGGYELSASDQFLEMTLGVYPIERGYEYSKLYYACGPSEAFREDRVICFRMIHAGRSETHRFVLPDEAVASGYIRLRLDALPYVRGTAQCDRKVRFYSSDDGSELNQRALWHDLKYKTRALVEHSERLRLGQLPHMPESISLELTAGCNLTCGHCSSHGTPGAHVLNNRRAAFSVDMLDKLAKDAFPSLSLINLVGRGEPMMVGLPLWGRLIRHLLDYEVLMTCVTNGSFLSKRIDANVLQVTDTITASIDGTTPEVFAANRGGASLDDWRRNFEYFNMLRDGTRLARRPRLGLSWTLKRNNIHQFPDFIRLAIALDAELLYVRHLFVFHEKDRQESLITEPELTNRYLSEGYALLEGRSIKLDAVPLSGTAQPEAHLT